MTQLSLSKLLLSRVGRSTVFVLALCHSATVVAQDAGSIRFRINDANGQPVPCRIHLKNEHGEAIQAAGRPFWNDHFVCPGQAFVEAAAGKYRWQIERGPEFERAAGNVDVSAEETATVNVDLRRIANLREEGWYSGDLHVHRPAGQIRQLMQADDLDFAPVITWWNGRVDVAADADEETEIEFDDHRTYTTMAGEDEREGGALLYFGLQKPLDLEGASREFPSPMHFAMQARQRSDRVWIDIEKPFWWDAATWLAVGGFDSIGLANNHMCRDQMLADEAWGRPRDVERLPNPRGNGFWTQEIYYHALNCGLRIPPSAGSASGVLPNPVGYNRVYVHLDGEMSRDAWFESLAAGRCFVTNGPFLRVQANGQLPGASFGAQDGSPLEIELTIQLTSNDRVPELEIIHNGRVVHRIGCAEIVDQKHEATLSLEGGGWFLVRAIADVDNTFRFASTGPWFIDPPDGRPRISRESAEFFREWVDERIARVKSNMDDPGQLNAVLEWHEQASEFWAARAAAANAD